MGNSQANGDMMDNSDSTQIIAALKTMIQKLIDSSYDYWEMRTAIREAQELLDGLGD